MRSTLYAMTAALAILGCSSAEQKAADADTAASAATTATPAVTAADPSGFHPAWSRSSVMYEINVRQYTPEGTIAALKPHLPRLKQLGVDILWLMPVQPIGVKNRKGKLGSYYAISDYTAINPEFGTEADFKSFVDAAHAQGFKVILDWVANHTAHDHEWVSANRDFHERKPDGTLINARDNDGKETDWTDVAELDYDNRAMRQTMISEMKWWIDRMGIDGFRCDVAGGVPMDFWTEARTALKAARPDLFLLAEAEDPKFHAAFDMTYGWELHHLLNAIAKGKQPATALDAYFAKDNKLYGRDAYRLYFTSNHDENSWQGSELERMGANHTPAFVLAATVQGSMPLLYTGQEVSMRKRLRFFEKDTVDWSGVSLAPFYASIFELKHKQAALANGPWGGAQTALETDGGNRVYAFTRTRDANTVLVAVNFGDAPANVGYSLFAHPGSYTDWFSKAPVELAANGKLMIPAHGYRVLAR
jgi:alpha-amylase